MEQLSGFSQQELLHKSLEDLDKINQNSTFYEQLKAQISEQKQFTCTVEQRHKNGKIYACQLKLTLQATEKYLSYFGVLQIVSETLLFDRLTGLPLRPLFNFTLQKNLARAQRHQKHFAVLLVNIENRREVRHCFGDELNDQWIQTLASMLKTTVRDSDTVAWDGESQFIVLLEEISQAKDAGLVGQMILFKLTQPLKLADQEIRGEINIGIAIYPQDHQDAESLVQMAEIALERARKQGGGGQCCFYNPQLQY
jgi:diguanylate cyclase (GGDEF)-like protein